MKNLTSEYAKGDSAKKYFKYLLILTLIFFATFPPYDVKMQFINFYEESQHILSGGESAFQYRYLSYYAFDTIFNAIHNIAPEQYKSIYRSTMVSIAIINFFTISIGLYFLLKLFEQKNRTYVLVFALLLIAIINKSHWYIQPYDALLFPFVMSSLYIIRKGQYSLLPALTFAAAFIHQIAFLIPLYYFFNQKFENKKPLKSFILKNIFLAVMWVIPYFLLRFVFFPYVPETSFSLFNTPLFLFAFLGNSGVAFGAWQVFDTVVILIPWVVLILLSLKYTLEKFQIHYRWAVVLFLIILGLAGTPSEIREFLSILPFLIPNLGSIKAILTKSDS